MVITEIRGEERSAGGTRAGDGRRAAVLPVVVGLVAMAAYVRTAMPDVGFWDTAEFQTILPIMGTAHPTGFPTYVIVGWVANLLLTPFGEPAYRMNLLSGIFVAGAAALAVVLARRLTESTSVAIAAGLGLAMTPTAWAIGTHADPHALHLALVAGLLVLLVGWGDAHAAGSGRADRWLIAASAVFALAVGNHSLTLLLAVPVGLYVLAVDPKIVRRPRFVATCVAVLVGVIVVVYVQMPVRAGIFPAPLIYGHPETWDGFRYVVLAEQFRGSIVDPLGNLDVKAAELVALAAAQFGGLAILIPLGFVATLARRPRYALLSGSALAVTVFFSASYVNADISRYYLVPALIAWTWLAILAAVVVDQLPMSASGRGLQRASLVIAGLALLAPTVGALPERAVAVDRSADLGSRPWTDAALAAFAPDAVVVSWWSYSTALWYAQHVDGRRPDLWVVDDRTRLDQNLGDVIDVIDANFGTRPVYLIRTGPGEVVRLRERYVIEPIGNGQLANVYLVEARVAATE
ncbi:MAG: DUF2723 domain-containing protein [Chloroflexota bacterium]